MVAYYRTNFNLMKEHGFSLTEIETMLPFEREFYISLLLDWIQKRKEEEEANK